MWTLDPDSNKPTIKKKLWEESGKFNGLNIKLY